MPSNKFFGKSKEDLVLLATLGRVLTLQQANDMTQADLAAFLSSKDQETGTNRSTDQINISRETIPLMKRQTETEISLPRKTKPKEPADSTKEAASSAEAVVDSTRENPSEKISKKELNKQRFLRELAGKNGTAPQTEATPVPEPEAEKKARKILVEKGKADKNPKPEKSIIKTIEIAAIPNSPKSRAKKPKISSFTPEVEALAAVKDETEQTGNKFQPIKKLKPVKKSAKPMEPVLGNPSSEAGGQKDETPVVPIIENVSVPDETVPETAGMDSAHPIKHQRHINKTPAVSEDSEAEPIPGDDGEKRKHEKVVQPEELEIVEGALEIMPDGYGFLRKFNYLQGPKDIYIPPQYIRRFGLRPGDWITGPGKLQRDTDRYQAILYIKEVNGLSPEKMIGRPQFDQLTPIYPDVRYVLETGRNELSTRIIDLVAPIGKGQRGMIVSPPKAGKTILLQKIANAIATNNPEAKLIVLLIDERPEEVTDMQRSINGEVVYSTFDKTPENHVKIVELVLERAMRLVELGQDVVILLDSITRLARAYNLTINPTGRTLSGGLDPGALYGPKRFFGSARNIENGGSLTIIATSLIDTGSRMDEVIFEEFKGTGNMEVYLDRKLSEKRIFPAIDLNRSGTRREELLLSKRELDAVWTIRKAFGQLDTSAVTEMIINLLLKTNNNSHFVSSVNVSLNDKAMFDAMRGTKPNGNGGQGNGGQGAGGGYGNSYGSGSSYGN